MKKIIVKFNNEMEKRLGLDILTYAACRDIKEEENKLIGTTKVPDENWHIVEHYILRRTFGNMKVKVEEVKI